VSHDYLNKTRKVKMPDITPTIYDRVDYNEQSGKSTVKIPVADINAGIVSILLPSAFLAFPRNNISYTFVDVSEVPVTPGAGTITFMAKTAVNPDFAEGIIGGDAMDATLDPISLFFSSAATEIDVSSTGVTIATDVIVRIKGYSRT